MNKKEIIFTFIAILIVLIICTIFIITFKIFKSDNKENNTNNNSNNNIVENELVDSLETLNNPERGFYLPSGINISDEKSYEKALKRIKEDCEEANNKNITIIHLRYNIGSLSGNVNGSSDIYLNDNSKELTYLDNILNVIKEHNLKTIVRFAYTYEAEEGCEPTSFNAISNHIEYFSKVINRRIDTVMLVEAGFLGPWGEMHSANIYESEEYYSKLIELLLKNLDERLTINVRTPKHYVYYFKSLNNDNINKYRVGIFNDSYMGSASDRGTFNSEYPRSEFVEWMETQGLYTYYGGEASTSDHASSDDLSYSDMDYVLSEIYRTHTNYLNVDYNEVILNDKWEKNIYQKDDEYKGQDFLKFIEDHLGYRFVLRKSDISKLVKQGEKLSIDLTIENVGFNRVISNYNAYIILSNSKGYYIAPLDIEINRLFSRDKKEYSFSYSIPNNIEVGEYNIYLKLENELNNNLTIQFANKDIYDSSLNANKLGSINIENGNGEYTSFKELDSDQSEGTYVSLQS